MYLKKVWKTALIAMAAGAILVAVNAAGTNSSEILKARISVKKGQPLSADMFETVQLNTSEGWMVPPGTDFAHMVAKRDIAPNEFLSKHDLSNNQVLAFSPDEREFTVQTDLARCVGGDLAAGDLADVLFFDKGTLQSQPLFTVTVLGVNNRSGQSIHDAEKDIRDEVPATVKIKVTVNQAAALLAYEQRGLVAFAKIPDEAAKQVVQR